LQAVTTLSGLRQEILREMEAAAAAADTPAIAGPGPTNPHSDVATLA
jgi:hypothetical protein